MGLEHDTDRELQALALQFAALAVRADKSKMPLRVEVEVCGVFVNMTATTLPPHMTAPTLTQCERDCVEGVRQAYGPITTSRLLAWMESTNRLWGESTIKVALSRLVKTGWLTAGKVAPRGYRLGPRMQTSRSAGEAAS